MGMFDKILGKLGLGKKEEEEPRPAVRRTVDEATAAQVRRLTRIREIRENKEIPMVDVVAKLEKIAEAQPLESNWKTSIADLLFLLGLDHSYDARVELAKELGCPEEYMDDSAKMNTWLHKTVLQKLAENGGNVPMELLD